MLFRKETSVTVVAAQLWTYLIRRAIRVRVEVELYTYLIRTIVILVRVEVVSSLQSPAYLIRRNIRVRVEVQLYTYLIKAIILIRVEVVSQLPDALRVSSLHRFKRPTILQE